MRLGAAVGVTLKFSDNSEAKAGFAVKSDEAALERAAKAEPFLDDADPVVRNVANAGEEDEQEKRQTST